MYQNERMIEPIKQIDVSDYVVVCPSLTRRRLSAALQTITKGADPRAFAFQLVPSAPKRGKTGGTFLVTSCEQRVNWMREIMLARAVGQKNKGYEMQWNGRPI
jgi:hypothetical protein